MEAARSLRLIGGLDTRRYIEGKSPIEEGLKIITRELRVS
jgi:hypothetical protein